MENPEELSAQLARLLKEHADAIANWTFLGLSDEESFQHDRRRERIRELYAQQLELRVTLAT
jgi:hypothetical protein